MGRRAVPPRHGGTDRRWDGSGRWTPTPLTDVTAVQSAIALTGRPAWRWAPRARHLSTASPTSARSSTRCAAEGSVLDGAELVLLIPVLDAGPRAAGLGPGRRSPSRPTLARLTDAPAPPDRPPRHASATPSTTTAASPIGRARGSDQLRARRSATGAGGSSPTSSACSRPRATVSSPTGSSPCATAATCCRCGPRRARACAASSTTARRAVRRSSSSPRRPSRPTTSSCRRSREEEQEIGPHPGRADRRGPDARLDELETLVDGDRRARLGASRAPTRPSAWRRPRPTIDRDGRGRAAGRPPSAAAGPGLARSLARPSCRSTSSSRPSARCCSSPGPNAGGKTIALKTLALCRADGPGRLPRAGRRGLAPAGVRRALRDHRRRAVGGREPLDLLGVREADPRGAGRGRRIARSCSLDELGAGTDPDEGAALAQAILEDAGRRAAPWWWPPPTSSRSGVRVHAIPARATPRSSSTRATPGADVPAALRPCPARATRSPSPARLGLVAGADRPRAGPPLRPTPRA